MSVTATKTSDFTAVCGESYFLDSTGTITVTLPSISSDDNGIIFLQNINTGIIIINAAGGNTINGASSFTVPGNAKYLKLEIHTDKSTKWYTTGLLVTPTITLQFPFPDWKTTTSTQSVPFPFPEQLWILTPADYGFPWATVMTAVITYYISNNNGTATTTADLQLVDIINGTYAEVSGSSVSHVGLVLTKKTATVTLENNSRYHCGAKTTAGVLVQANVSACLLTITFS